MSKAYEVLWAAAAEKDLLGIVDYIADDSPDAARGVLREITDATARLHRSPQRGRVVPELLAQGIARYRELVIQPWRIIYRVENLRVYVLAVIDSRRNVEDILLARLIK